MIVSEIEEILCFAAFIFTLFLGLMIEIALITGIDDPELPQIITFAPPTLFQEHVAIEFHQVVSGGDAAHAVEAIVAEGDDFL